MANMWQPLACCCGTSKDPVVEHNAAQAAAKAPGSKGSSAQATAAAAPAGDAIAAYHTQGAAKQPKSVKWASSEKEQEDEDAIQSLPNSKDGVEAHLPPHSSADSNTDGSMLVDAGEYSTQSRSLAAHRNTSSHSSGGSNCSTSSRRRSALGRPEGDSAAQQRQQGQQQQQGQAQHEHNGNVPGTLSCESSGYLDACTARMEDSMSELQHAISYTSERARSFKSRQSSIGGSVRSSFAGSMRSSGGSHKSNTGGSRRGSTGGFVQEPVPPPVQQAAAAAEQQGNAVLPFAED